MPSAETLQLNGSVPALSQKIPHGKLSITDIQTQRASLNIKDDILAMMDPSKGQRSLPTLLLYSEKGLQLFEEVCDRSPAPGLTCIISSNTQYRSHI